MLHGQTSTAGRDRLRLRQGLVVAQIALALAVTITAGLFVRTLLAASRIDSGFRTANVDVITLDTSLADATGSRAVPLMERVVDRVRAIGGVESVGHARMIPLEGGSFAIGRVRVPGASEAALARLNDDNWDVVSPDYFRSVGLPVVDGRALQRRRSRRTAARGDRQRIVRADRVARTIRGRPARLAGARRRSQAKDTPDEGRPLDDRRRRQRREIPHDRRSAARVHLRAVRAAAADARRVVRETRRGTIRSNATCARRSEASTPDLPIVRIQSFEEAAAIGLFPRRLAAWVAACAGVIGIFLAALGLYGLAAFLVAQRTREIAIRMALGATQRDVRSMVLSQAARLERRRFARRRAPRRGAGTTDAERQLCCSA